MRLPLLLWTLAVCVSLVGGKSARLLVWSPTHSPVYGSEADASAKGYYRPAHATKHAIPVQKPELPPAPPPKKYVPPSPPPKKDPPPPPPVKKTPPPATPEKKYVAVRAFEACKKKKWRKCGRHLKARPPTKKFAPPPPPKKYVPPPPPKKDPPPPPPVKKTPPPATPEKKYVAVRAFEACKKKKWRKCGRYLKIAD